MKRLFTVFLALIALCFASQAQAVVFGPLENWKLDLTSLGGPVVTGIDSINMNGTVHLTQNVSGPGGTPVVGDTFTLTNAAAPGNPIVFTGTSYVNSALVEIIPLLAPGQGTLFLQSPTLTGSIIEILAGNMYRFQYNNPGNGTITLNYTSPSATTTTLANFDLIPAQSGGVSTDNFVGGTGLQTGTSNISGTMHVTTAGVLLDASNTDLINYGPLAILLGALQGGLVYQATNTGTQIIADIRSDDSFTISAAQAPAIPEPMSMMLLGSGIAGMAALRRRGRKNA